MKRCPACQQTKTLADFAVDRSRRDGRVWRCRSCCNAADRVRRAKRRLAEPKLPRACRNCHAGRHGRWCTAALWGPPCPCRCRAVLGLDGPFEGADPSEPWWDDRYKGVA